MLHETYCSRHCNLHSHHQYTPCFHLCRTPCFLKHIFLYSTLGRDRNDRYPCCTRNGMCRQFLLFLLPLACLLSSETLVSPIVYSTSYSPNDFSVRMTFLILGTTSLPERLLLRLRRFFFLYLYQARISSDDFFFYDFLFDFLVLNFV